MYGFMVQANSVPPVISVNIKDGTYRKAADFDSSVYQNNKIPFTVKDESGLDVTLTVQTKIVNGYLTDSDVTEELKNLDTFNTTEEVLSSSEAPLFNKEFAVNLGNLASLEKTNYTVIVRITADSETATTKNVYFYADNKAPYLDIENAELTQEDNSGNRITDGIIITEENSVIQKPHTGSNNTDNYIYKVNGRWSDENGSGTGNLTYRYKASGMNSFTEWQNFTSNEAPQVQNLVSWSK